MDNLEFVQGLYNGKYCYSDSMTEEQIALLRIPSGVEDIIRRMVAENRIIFLTGNPGDGKTYLIKAIMEHLHDVFIETDMNRVRDEKIDSLMNDIINCYEQNKPCIIAANEFPFHKLVNHFRVCAPRLYKEIMEVKRNVLIYGQQTLELKRICIIDLNERNLLDKDRCIVKQILDKFTSLLQPYSGSNTGSGKTIFLYSILVSLLEQFSADELELLIVDPKQTDFHFFEELPHLRGGRVLTDADEAIAALETINAIDKQERTNIIKAANCRDSIIVLIISPYFFVYSTANFELWSGQKSLA